MEKLILFYGDSITDAERKRSLPLSTGEGFVTIASGKLSYENPGKYRFINRGVHGNRLPQLLTRLHADVLAHKPDILTILVGINDLFHEYAHKIEDGRERYETYYRLLLEEIKKALPDTKIILMSPFAFEGEKTVSNEENPNRYEFLTGEIPHRAKIVESLAKEYGHAYLPLHEKFAEVIEHYPSNIYFEDGIHPNFTGSYLLAQNWLGVFEDLIEK
jgi:lysophospholipase L1-like esterase